MPSFRLKITDEDIRLGIRKHQSLCPIARALSREFPTSDVQVEEKIYLGDGVEFEHSCDSRYFMEDFDDGVKVEPQELLLLEPEEIEDPESDYEKYERTNP